MTAQVALGPAIVVDAPPVTAGSHGLIASAMPIEDGDDRWTMGFMFWPENCVAPSGWFPGCAAPETQGQEQIGSPSGGGVLKSASATNIGFQDYLPATYESQFECSSTGWQAIDYQGRAMRQVTRGLSNALETEFWTGTLVPTNYNLVGNTPGTQAGQFGGVLNAVAGGLYTPVHVEDALSLLVGALASCGAGNQGMIHAPAQIAEQWAETQSLLTDGPRLRTKTRGNVVVAGGGYPGTGPAGLATAMGGSAAAQAAPANGDVWVYATDMVAVRVDDPVVYPTEMAEAFVIDAVGHRTNQIQFRGEQIAAAYCGSCCSFAVLVQALDNN